jgi:hypothetical protein
VNNQVNDVYTTLNNPNSTKSDEQALCEQDTNIDDKNLQVLPKFLDAANVDTDALTILIPIKNKDRQKYVVKRCEQLAEVSQQQLKLNGYNYSKKQTITKDSSYDMNFTYFLTDNAKPVGKCNIPTIRLSSKPRGNRAWIRVEVSGFPLKNKEILLIRLAIEFLIGPKNYNKYILKAHISRIDIAADFTKVKPDDLVFNQLRSQKGSSHYDRYGGIETMYLGEKRNSSHLIVYSRNAKFRNLRLKDILPQVTTRFEYRFKLRRYPLINLLNLEDPFIKVDAYDVAAMIESDYFSIDFIDAITGKGLLPIMQRRTPEEQKLIKDKMYVHKVHWFQTGKIMELWRSKAVQLSLLTLPDSEVDKDLYDNVKKSFQDILNLNQVSKKSTNNIKNLTNRES